MSRPIRPNELPDEALVERVRAGDVALFELLVRRHNQRLYRVTRSILGGDHAAEDAVQEAHFTAFRKLDQFEGRSRYATWLTRIAVREALTWRRRRREIPVDAAHPEETMVDPRQSPERRASSTELGRVIEEALDEIPADFRLVFVLRTVQGLSVAETAACVGIPEATVKTRLHRGRGLLQELLAGRVDLALEGVHTFAGERCDRITSAVMDRVCARGVR